MIRRKLREVLAEVLAEIRVRLHQQGDTDRARVGDGGDGGLANELVQSASPASRFYGPSSGT